ncbi:amino acid ABC transporter substrate-binding protein [Undibacter mobilis]|uniref:Branched-chain amino acid ABC transporter substrate-binding protein n=1 Tax=Undibacter mobilis TaxID=2292256 RepID=A0A371B6T5_9BRAD|nr:amino acid ABC transporter substrate-binding protein [Undibacter mobilis]RDV03315.1 branched-chain amino acid ABC transporter substrate-binding protein [Undibacter mobilis]
MLHSLKSRKLALIAGVSLAVTAAMTLGAHAQDTVKIGFSQSLTGFLSPNGKQALLGQEIWADRVNKAGGLLGKKVELKYYDDKSQGSEVPGIYTKLIDVDKVDLVVSGYASNQIAPAMPVVMSKKKTFISLFGLDINDKFKYDKYFSIIPTGQDTKGSFTQGWFDVAMQQSPKPQTIALTFADAEFSQNACEGARATAKKLNLKIVYDKAYPPPPKTTDFAPIVRAIKAENPDLVMICSYPLDSIGLVLAAHEVDLKPKMMGGAMVGLQATPFKDKLKGKLNGIVNYETWVPDKKQMYEGAEAFYKEYQSRAGAAGVDPLGYYLGGWGYAQMQVLEAGIKGAKSFDDAKIAEYLKKATVQTVVGPIKFGAKGEWADSRMMQVQYHSLTDAANLETWRGMSYQTVVDPPSLATGKLIYPYEKAMK